MVYAEPGLNSIGFFVCLSGLCREHEVGAIQLLDACLGPHDEASRRPRHRHQGARRANGRSRPAAPRVCTRASCRYLRLKLRLGRRAEKEESYPAEALAGTGTVKGHTVACIAPESLVRFHTGYDAGPTSPRCASALCARFGIQVPREYLPFNSPTRSPPELHTTGVSWESCPGTGAARKDLGEMGRRKGRVLVKLLREFFEDLGRQGRQKAAGQMTSGQRQARARKAAEARCRSVGRSRRSPCSSPRFPSPARRLLEAGATIRNFGRLLAANGRGLSTESGS